MGGPGKKFDRALVVQETRFDFGNKGGKTICKGKTLNENGGKKKWFDNNKLGRFSIKQARKDHQVWMDRWM